MIQLYCCYTEAHKVLFDDYFVPSLPNNIIVRAHRLDLDGSGDFLSTEFLDTIKRKVRLIRESLERHRGEVIIWSDIDIIFFKSVESEVRELLDAKNLDAVFQAEGFHTSDVNSGFFAIRCNQRAIDFFNAVLARMQAEPEKNEQPIVNDLLQEKAGALNWGKLPFSYAARSQDWPPVEQQIALYHANCTAGKDGVRKKCNQFTDLKEHFPYARHKICIVTPELEGPRSNSGIGTHVFYFSQYLKTLDNHDVTIFLSTESYIPCPEADKSWETYYFETYGVHLVLLENQAKRYPEIGWFSQWFCERSLIVSKFLEHGAFDVCYFQDLNADAFHTIQSRITGLGFQKTILSVMVNGPNLWAKQGMKQFAHSIVDDPLVNFCESYCLQNCDLVTAPSEYAIQWCKDQEWPLTTTRVTPYMINVESLIEPETTHSPADEILFFGRLETRKGLLLLLDSLRGLLAQGRGKRLRRVHFLGHHTRFMDFDSKDIIYERFQEEPLSSLAYSVHSDLNHSAAMAFLREHKDALIVTPSYSETLGYTLIECLVLGANLIATDAGAIPELFEDKGRLCKPEPRALGNLIEQGLEGVLPPLRRRYCPSAAKTAWAAAHEQCLNLREERTRGMLEIPEPPLVSVCVPHYNYGQYLPEQIESLAAQTYERLEILVADDGSTEPRSIETFRQLKQRYESGTFKFIEHPNMGLCENRNDLVERARGEFIVFCDADNISKPRMVEILTHAILHSKADCVTCHMEKFRIDPLTGERHQLDHYTPLGPCLEAAPFVDPFGDANFIIRKEVFEAMEGFRTVPQTASEDWEFLAELVLRGFKLEVVPDDLFEYREHANSNMRQTNFYDTRMRTLKPFFDRMETWQARILYNAVGMYENYTQRLRMGQICNPEDVDQRLRELRLSLEANAANQLNELVIKNEKTETRLKAIAAEREKTLSKVDSLDSENADLNRRLAEMERECQRLVKNPFLTMKKRLSSMFSR